MSNGAGQKNENKWEWNVIFKIFILVLFNTPSSIAFILIGKHKPNN